MTTTPKQHTLELLRAMLNDQANFRSGQWETIESVVIHRKRALAVQRTGGEKASFIFWQPNCDASRTYPAHQPAALAHAEPN